MNITKSIRTVIFFFVCLFSYAVFICFCNLRASPFFFKYIFFVCILLLLVVLGSLGKVNGQQRAYLALNLDFQLLRYVWYFCLNSSIFGVFI